jgi:hypothetical protein
VTRVTVLPDAFRRSWPPREGKPLRPHDRAYVLDLGAALERSYEADAHFAVYSTPNRHRLNYRALEQGVTVELAALVFDLDGPNHVATPEWRTETRQKICALFEAEGAGFYYETRGGARVVYRQEEPTVIATQEDGKEWRRNYAVLVANLARRFGLAADPACSDWQRLFRLPRATRDEGGSPENHPCFGDPQHIANLFVQATEEDVAAAKRKSRTPHEKQTRTWTMSTTTGDGLLYALLRARGDVGEEVEHGKWIVRCPNRSRHTTNTDGTSSTVLYEPRNGAIGMLDCKHAHCCNLSLREVLNFFSDAEIGAVWRAAVLSRTS